MVGFASNGVTCTLEAIMTIFRQIFRDQFLLGNCRERAPTIYRLLFRSHTQKIIDCRKLIVPRNYRQHFLRTFPQNLFLRNFFGFRQIADYASRENSEKIDSSVISEMIPT